MPLIPGISSERAIRVLEKAGFRVVRQGRHVVMSNGFVRLTIPRHNPINAHTMGAIAMEAGLTPDEFRGVERPRPSASGSDSRVLKSAPRSLQSPYGVTRRSPVRSSFIVSLAR